MARAVVSPEGLTWGGDSQGCLVTWQLASPGAGELREKVTEHPRWKPQSFNNLVSEMTSHAFCHILFIRNELLTAAHTRGGDYIEARTSGHLGPAYKAFFNDLKFVSNFLIVATIQYCIMMF